MTGFILKRMAGMAGVLLAVSIAVFVIFNVIPGGDPALRLAGRRPTQENIIQIRKKWGFDQPYWVQYLEDDGPPVHPAGHDQLPGSDAGPRDDQARHPADALAGASARR